MEDIDRGNSTGGNGCAPSLFETLHVLLIEDNPGDARLFEELLRETDTAVQVRWEKRLADGLDALRGERPDVLVVDLGLPDSDGVDTAARCAEAVPDVPIVVLTGQDHLETALRALEAGATEYLQKETLTPGLVARTLRWAVERRRMKATIDERETWIRSITENVPNGVYRSTPEGDLIYANEAFVSMFGYASAHEMEQVASEELYADPGARDRLLRREHERGHLDGVEVEFQRKDGSTFTGLLNSTVVRDEDGEVQYYDGAVADISERKEAEEALRQSEELHRATLSNITDAVFLTRDDGTFAYVCPNVEHIFGRTQEEVEALGTISALLGSDPAADADLDADEALTNRECTIEDASGQRHDLLVNVRRVSIQEGSVLYTCRDVTERKRAENELRRSEQLTRGILDALAAHVAVLDGDGTIVDVNEQWERFGRENDADMDRVGEGTNYLQVCEDARRYGGEGGDVARGLREVLDGRRGLFEHEYPCHGPDEKRWFVLRATHLDREGEGAVVAHFNITERRKAEEQLRLQASALEASASAIAITDPEGRMIWVNPAFTELTGYTEEEATGHTMALLSSGEHDEAFYKDLWTTVQSGDVWQGELVNERKDGRRYVEEQTITPVTDDDGEVQHFIAIKQDVTERKETERALRRSRDLLAKAQEIAHLGSWEFDLRTDKLYWSDETYRIFGWDPDETVSVETFMEAVHPEDRDRLREQQTALIEEGEPSNVEYRIRRPDGEERILHERGEAEFGDDATPVRVYGTAYDVTEQKEAERIEAQLAAIVRASPNAIISTDPEGVIQTWNDAATELYGFTADEAVGQPISIVIPPDRTSVFREKIDRLRGGTAIGPLETVRQRKDGTRFDALVSAAPIQDEDDETLGFAASVVDITERKEAEAELRRSRERWQRLIENMQDALEISVDGVIRYANPAAADLVGADDPEAIIGEPLTRFLPSEELRALIDERRERIERGETTEPYEHEIERLDGERRMVESYSVPVEYEGHSAAQTMIRDVTEQRQLETQLRQAQKMETVGTLAGGIAHDFNNILHSAMAYVQLSLQDLPEDHTIHTYLARTEDGLKQGKDLVRKLLTFSRPENSASDEPVDLAPLVRETLELAEPSFPKGLEVRTALPESCVVNGDAGQVRQVVMNLLTNAGQAMAEQPSGEPAVLDVRLHHVDVDPDLATQYLHLDTGRYVQLSISDTGIGMDAATKERIFDPFFTTKESGEQKGTGLGLSVVHGIVQALDGEITVHSEPEEGTTFDVYLPATAATGGEPASAEETADPVPETKGHVLVVDDDASVLELESIRLPRLGYEVTTCRRAQEALDLLTATPAAVDLVLTDYQMPGMQGLELARTLRAREIDVPVVLMSGFRAQVSEEEARREGADEVLQKPVSRETLSQVVAKLAGRSGRAGA